MYKGPFSVLKKDVFLGKKGDQRNFLGLRSQAPFSSSPPEPWPPEIFPARTTTANYAKAYGKYFPLSEMAMKTCHFAAFSSLFYHIFDLHAILP